MTATVVTGAAGFIGSHVAEALLAAGHTVLGIDHGRGHPPETARLHLAPLGNHPNFTLLRGDIADLPLEPLLDGVDTVFHLAGRPGVRSSWGAEFADYCRSNVLGTHRLLEAANTAGVRRAVVSSSSSVYGHTAQVPLTEDMATSPLSPYGVTKLATELLALAHAARPGSSVSAVGLRYFTVYGPRQRADMAISIMIRAALTGEPMTVYGDGTQRRDFTFVGDIVRGNLLAMAADTDSAVVNLGTGVTTSVLELVDLVGEVVGRPVAVRFAGTQDGDVPFTHADMSHAAEVLGYRPTVDLRAGIERQLAWIQETALSWR